MRFVIKNTFGENIVALARKIGYFLIGGNKEKSELNFIRPLERSGYPRFHLYLKTNRQTQEIIFSLHLDQKKPAYKGAPAHAADYEGGAVETEAERIQRMLKQ